MRQQIHPSVWEYQKTKMLYRIRKTMSFYGSHIVTFICFNAFRSKPGSFLLPKAFFFQRIAAHFGRTVCWTKTSESQNTNFFGSPVCYPQITNAAEQGLFYGFCGGFTFLLCFKSIIESKTDWNTYIYTSCHIVSSCCVIHQCKRVDDKDPMN